MLSQERNMTPIFHKNQEHPPLPKRKRVDSMGNNRKRMFFKKGDASMLFCKGITEEAARVFENSMRDTAKKLGVTIEGNFIITQGK